MAMSSDSDGLRGTTERLDREVSTGEVNKLGIDEGAEGVTCSNLLSCLFSLAALLLV